MILSVNTGLHLSGNVKGAGKIQHARQRARETAMKSCVYQHVPRNNLHVPVDVINNKDVPHVPLFFSSTIRAREGVDR